MGNGAILVIGAGGLGAPAATALARGAATRIGIVDPDPVELSNLARQVLYRVADIGIPKSQAAARRLAELAPASIIESYPVRLDQDNAAGLIAPFDFVIDGTDDPSVKFLINDVCVALGRPFTYGGVLGFGGQAMTILPGVTACLRCLFEEPPDEAEVASCRDAGILGPVAGAIGEIQAAEALACVRGGKAQLAGAILTYAGAELARIRLTSVYPRLGCPCGVAERARRDELAGNTE